jgi:two-component system sensor histidine kinase/response regulator
MSATAAKAEPGDVVERAVPTTSPVTVLLVDDNADKRLALKSVLSPLGYSVVEADSGLAALRCVMAQDFAVILLDVRMPDMNGFETAALLRQRRQSEMTPIIFITAYSSDEIDDSDRYAEGAVDFIFGPVPPEELRAKVSVFANLFSRADKLAEQNRAVQASADQLRRLTDAAPVGIFQTDTNHRYLYTNPRWSEITGIPFYEAAGREWNEIIGSEARAGSIVALPDAGPHEAESVERFEIRVPDGPPRIVLVTSRPVSRDDGGEAGRVGTIADITAEVGAEAAMSHARDKATEASRLKSDFLANMSHEIRTPMNGVLGMTDLLLETNLDAHQRDCAQTVRNSGEGLLTIINDILDFSKIEAGKLEPEDVEFDLRSIIDDVMWLLAGSAQSKGLELAASVDRAVPSVVSGDPGRVRQVLTNLVGNATKFTHDGEVVLRVAVTERAETGAVVRFEVADTGDGIAAEKLATIFQPFVQADSSTTRRYGGTGLGLAISSQLVGIMGGHCGVSSQIGAGSTFWFTIRVHAVSPFEEPDRPSFAVPKGVTALIIDASATQREIVGTYLEDCGVRVEAADSAEAALDAMRTAADQGRPFDVAFLDLSVPGVDGVDLKDTIRHDPGLTAGLVLMTGRGSQGDLAPGEETGIRAILSKPVREKDLLGCLRVALDPGDILAAPTEMAIGRPSPGDPERGRLLLAEDNLINQKVAVAMLSSGGYRVDTVLTGAEAVQAVVEVPYDAVLMDCQMPDLNGYEATAAIRAHEEGSDRHTPIIAITAGARREDRGRCLAEGMDSYLAKPMNKDALLALVGRFVKNGRAR